MPGQNDTPGAEPATRNARLAELAALAHEFLFPYAGMPDICAVRLEIAFSSSRYADIDLQIQNTGAFQDIASWALELGGQVRFVDEETYVDCYTETETHGHSVKIWTHVESYLAGALLTRLWETLSSNGVDVDPYQLLPAEPASSGEPLEDGSP